MDYSIETIQAHHYKKGAAAYQKGHDIDSHGMQPGAVAIVYFQRGWLDERASTRAKRLVAPIAAGVPP